MRFLADMGVSRRVLDHLEKEGHDVLHLGDVGLQRLPDTGVYGKAVAEERIVLAFDLDFGEVAVRHKGPWTSVIVFRLVNTTTPHVIERLDVALAVAGDALEHGAIVVVEESRCRIRRLPIEPAD